VEKVVNGQERGAVGRKVVGRRSGQAESSGRMEERSGGNGGQAEWSGGMEVRRRPEYGRGGPSVDARSMDGVWTSGKDGGGAIGGENSAT
jgi:hypothetical protein